MATQKKRIALNSRGGYVLGLNAVITGVVLAANEFGWEVVGIRDDFDEVLFPECYPEGGLLKLTAQMVENLSAVAALDARLRAAVAPLAAEISAPPR